MFEPLVLIDMLLAVAVVVAAAATGRRAARLPAHPTDAELTAARLRHVLYLTAALVAARTAVTGLLATGGLPLVEDRLLVQVPLAVLPVAWAVVAVRRRWHAATASRAAAVGALSSGLWSFVPYSTLIELVVSLIAIGLAVAATTWLKTGARTPWTAATATLAVAVVLAMAYQSNVSSPAMDWGSGPAHDHHGTTARSVTELTGPRDRAADVRFTLTAAHGTVRLASGRQVDGLTFNGQAPGPEIRVRVGQLLEVALLNKDLTEGVTVHWHGVDVPNAEDGVPGVTQRPVLPGQVHVYRFVPERAGTFWYHTHRDAAETVERGLFGAFIVDDGPLEGAERTVFTHLWPGTDPIAAFGVADLRGRDPIPMGRQVKLRLINSSPEPQRLHVSGTTFTVAAIDRNATHGPTPLPSGTRLLLAAGGRFDIGFTIPDGTVTLALDAGQADDSVALAFSPDGAPPAAVADGPIFDPLRYGTPGSPDSQRYDRSFDLRLDDGFGFSSGRFAYVSSSINGHLYPAVPMLMVTDGDRVKVRVVNRSIIDHPMHLHGHRVRILSRNGAPVTGSPWWTDTLNLAPGEIFEVAFTADNPGIWMDHCHNFKHVADGMVMHLAYAGVTTPYTQVGGVE
jgi:FtsP/CotA-like multicopper oxidase with cupredoxin domain